MENQKSEHRFKISFRANSQTGKTSLIERFQVDSRWRDAVSKTNGIDYSFRRIVISDKKIKLELFDFPYQVFSNRLAYTMYSNNHAFFLVYDISNMDSFLSVNRWIQGRREYGEKKALIFLIGNKCELEDERKVSYEEGRLLAEKEGLIFVEVSAKTLENTNFLVGLVPRKLIEFFIHENQEKVEEPERINDPNDIHKKIVKNGFLKMSCNLW